MMVFLSPIYGLPTSRLSCSLPLRGDLVLVLGLLRQESLGQEHAKEVLSTILDDLDYHLPLSLSQLKLSYSSTKCQCFFLKYCRSHWYSCPRYQMT